MRRNHAVLALFAMAEASGHEPDVALNIDKRIPVGAGMAGGSADAAATILALNTLWDLDWPIERLQEVAATLGADMPFCLTGGYARGTGFGERIEQLDDDGDIVRDLTERGFTGHLLVGAYRAELRTPEVYATFDQIGAGDGDENHLQKAAVSLHPRSGQAIEEALRAGSQPGVRLRFRPIRHRVRADGGCGGRRAAGMAGQPLRRSHHRHERPSPTDCAYHRMTHITA